VRSSSDHPSCGRSVASARSPRGARAGGRGRQCDDPEAGT
jgi:hypothetical protein